ncbi:hypothetical protein MKW92_025909 [Papaver armeniacum]|nr:hypothetical protein MKW92_025909 [Papaver armeniacum]
MPGLNTTVKEDLLTIYLEIFMPIHTGAEKDLRLIYCAASISSLLNNWSGMDMEKAEEYIVNCQSYE